MDILGYTILVLILISGLPLLLFAIRRGKDNEDKTPDESEWEAIETVSILKAEDYPSEVKKGVTVEHSPIFLNLLK